MKHKNLLMHKESGKTALKRRISNISNSCPMLNTKSNKEKNSTKKKNFHSINEMIFLLSNEENSKAKVKFLLKKAK